MTPFEPPPGRQVFAQAFSPAPDDIDVNGHVNNIVYLRWAQDVAVAHWLARTAGAAEADAWTWVVLRHEIDYRRPLLPGRAALARTWVGEPKGARFARYVRIDGPEGRMCAQVVTDWCLIDAASGRASRIPDWMAALFF